MTYEYACTACGHAWEAEQSISAKPLTECPECHAQTAKRQVSGGAGFILKGGGWYADGYGSSKKSDATSSASPSDSSSAGASATKSDSNSSSTAASSASTANGTTGSAASAGSSSKPAVSPKPAAT